MRRNWILSVVMAISLAVPGIALAQGYGNRDRDDHAQQRSERGAGPHHAYYRGDRIPARENNQKYVVNDWRARHLRQPPKGHHWVRSGNDYVLAAITTGIIADIALSQR